MKDMFGYICCVIGIVVGVFGLYFDLGWGWSVAAAVIFIYGLLVLRAARRGNDLSPDYDGVAEMDFDFDD
jgi:hypothetical protein